MSSGDSTSDPTCPHCDAEDTQWYEGVKLNADGDTADVECFECGKKYKMTLCVEYSFFTEKIS